MKISFFAFIFLPLISFSQAPTSNVAEIKLKLKKLNFLGSVLYVAAHPDDENTRIITYLANDRLAATGYLSMTRGDGGQNLIGPELRDLLGLIRTQELLAARKIDGGEQYFTRANDFGFSKSPTEALEVWGKDKILSDVVKVFRAYQPDVVITRFPPDQRAGHGHHTASAMLAIEAFDLASDHDVFPAQLEDHKVWQPKRLYTNTGRWWNSGIDENTPGIIVLNVGAYNALLGRSYTEIAALSSSQHKSQGWGTAPVRGDQLEFLEHVKGDRATKDIFEGINTSWTRLKGGEKIQSMVEKVINAFDEDNVEAILPLLLGVRKEILALEPGVWKERKLSEVEDLIQDCAGLFIGVTADQYWTPPGEPVLTQFELINRSSANIVINQIRSRELNLDTTVNISLQNNKPIKFQSRKTVEANVSYSDPYWLKEPHDIGAFTVSDTRLIGKPQNPPAVTITFSMRVGGEAITIHRPLKYKWVDRVKGELVRPFEIVPPVFINLPEHVILFKDKSPRTIKVVLKSSSAYPQSGSLTLKLPGGWRAEPSSVSFELGARGEEQTKVFSVYPGTAEMTGSLTAVANINNTPYNRAIQVIAYDHFPIQTLLPESSAKVVRVELKGVQNGTIGYIRGAGDEVPQALRTMGYNVWEMKDEEVSAENLKALNAVVLGIRAVNTNPRIRYMMPALLDYVSQGGTLVVQYNTSGDLKTTGFTPFSLNLSRDRVTEEDAEVRILKPSHPVLQAPHKITQADFQGWVQERGLYFPDRWDNNFEAILSMNDKGESPKDGSLLIARYGNGYYVYTGLSFFRQLPEGVPGAYKLFANLVSLRAKSKPNGSSAGNRPK